uniref:rRNA adenine N(6)-methyltransferase n=1 Tax=Anas zonorhyncha TaxID=75864 RepID=A0A8B9UY80_9AVES
MKNAKSGLKPDRALPQRPAHPAARGSPAPGSRPAPLWGHRGGTGAGAGAAPGAGGEQREGASCSCSCSCRRERAPALTWAPSRLRHPRRAAGRRGERRAWRGHGAGTRRYRCVGGGSRCAGRRCGAGTIERELQPRRRQGGRALERRRPGILTRTLLNAGVRVVALESHPAFLPNLQSLENSLDGQLKVIYGDFFRLDPLVTGTVKPPAVCSDKLFEAMGVAAVPWRADVPVKIFGILPQKKERNTLWRLLFILYECSSIFRYGRVELNIFISEKEYKVLTAKPGESRAYQALSVLCQVGCEIQLLHMVSLLYQMTRSHAINWLPNDHLCLVRLTPQRDLFSEGLKPTNSATFIFMVKQCLAKRKSRLTDRLKENAEILSQKIPTDVVTGNLYPEDYKRLFEALQNSSVFTESWFHDEVLESIRNINL